jgi:hypothetical protein
MLVFGVFLAVNFRPVLWSAGFKLCGKLLRRDLDLRDEESAGSLVRVEGILSQKPQSKNRVVVNGVNFDVEGKK